uniref:CCHC-type domain-containing protein n=1 Tax=Otus sunia TaxID=257818 RepID=A0A8C8E6V1_9STRI
YCHSSCSRYTPSKATDNANEDCRRVIAVLHSANPSFVEMIDACSKVGTATHQMETLAKTVAVAVRGDRPCYGCGQTGHFKKNCSRKEHVNNMPTANIFCARCKKTGHYSKDCRSKFNAQGQLLILCYNQGNGWRSMRGGRADRKFVQCRCGSSHPTRRELKEHVQS